MFEDYIPSKMKLLFFLVVLTTIVSSVLVGAFSSRDSQPCPRGWNWDSAGSCTSSSTRLHQVSTTATTTPGELVAAAEYATLIHSLATQTQELRQAIYHLKDTAHQLQTLEIQHPRVSNWALGEVSSDLKAALAQAKASDDVYGPQSDHAYWKWRNVEDVVLERLDVNCIDGEIAAVADEDNGSDKTSKKATAANSNVRYLMTALEQRHHDYSAVVDTESIQAAVDALGTIEHFDRLVRFEVERMKVSATP